MNVVLVEDHLMFREVVRKICTHDFGLNVVGETESGTRAIDLIASLRPNIVVLDLGLPDLDGFEVMKQTVGRLEAPKSLILSSYVDAYTVYRVEHSNVSGFVDKKTTDSISGLKAALSCVQMGRTYFSHSYFVAHAARAADGKSFDRILSATEQEILTLIGSGFGDEEIAVRQGIAPSTAQTHRRNIAHKLRIQGTPKLIAFANRQGFTAFRNRDGRRLELG